MYPYLFGIERLPMYGILMFIGVALAVIVAVFKKRQNNIKKIDVFFSALFAFVFGLIGAKLFAIFGNLKYVLSNQLSIIDLIRSGFVFYGGFLGGVIGALTYAKIYKIKVLELFDTLAVGIPLGHAVGRMGCLCSGCCYGVPADSAIGIVFTHPLDPNTPAGIPLVPTQIIEAVTLVCIFAVLYYFSSKKRKAGAVTAAYCLLYAAARFVIEFFRGDIWRVFNNTITGSQLFAAGVIIVVGIVFFAALTKKKKNPVLFTKFAEESYVSPYEDYLVNVKEYYEKQAVTASDGPEKSVPNKTTLT